jgi:hypothetical protein
MMRPRITTWQCALAGGHFFKQARDSVPTHCTQKQETKFKQHRYTSQLHFFFSSFESADDNGRS